MSYSPKELKAIKMYADQNNAIPQLSVKPKMYFKLKDTGKEVSMPLSWLVQAYEKQVKEDAIQNRKEKNDEKRRQELKGYRLNQQ